MGPALLGRVGVGSGGVASSGTERKGDADGVNTNMERISGGSQVADPRLMPRLATSVAEDRNPRWSAWRVETVHPCNPKATDWISKVRRDVEAQRPEKWRAFGLPPEREELINTESSTSGPSGRPGSQTGSLHQVWNRPASRPGSTSTAVTAAGRVVLGNEFRPSSAYHFPQYWEEQNTLGKWKTAGASPPCPPVPGGPQALFTLDDDGFSSFPYSLAAHRAFLRTPLTVEDTILGTSMMNSTTKQLCKGAGGRAPIILSSDLA